MTLQTAGLVGTQAELCAVCDGERCPQGHVHQECGGQCAQQQQVGASPTCTPNVTVVGDSVYKSIAE